MEEEVCADLVLTYTGAGDPKSRIHVWLVGTVPTELCLFPELPPGLFKYVPPQLFESTDALLVTSGGKLYLT